MPVIPVLGGGKDQNFEVTLRYLSLGYIRPCVKGREGGREKGRERRNDGGRETMRN